MESQALNIEIYEFPFEKVTAAKSVHISPKLDKICVLSNEENALIFNTHQPRGSTPLWTGQTKYQSVAFSEEGEEFVATTATGSIHVFSCQGRQLVEVVEKSFAQLSSSLLVDVTDQVLSTIHLDVLVFNKKLLLLLCNHESLVAFRWNEGELWQRCYIVKTDPVKAARVREGNVYLLTEEGQLLTHSTLNGNHVSSVDLNALIAQGDMCEVARSFSQLAVSESRVAVVDDRSQVYLFRIDDLLAQQARTDQSKTATTHPMSSSVGHLPSRSDNINIFRGSESCPSRDAFPKATMTGSFGLLVKALSLDQAIEPQLDYTLLSALNGFLVCDLSFSPAGLTVWYSQPELCGLYRTYSVSTGVCLHEEELETGTVALLAGYLGCVDAFLSPSSLQLRLGSMSREQLAIKVLQRVGVSGIAQVMQGNGWQDISIALPVVSEGIGVRHIEVIRLALKLHFAGFGKAINAIPLMRNKDFILSNVNKLFEMLFSGIEDNLHTLNLAENLVMVSLNHCYDLLSSLYSASRIDVPQDWVDQVEQSLMKSVVNLRAYLYHAPQPPQEPLTPSIPPELEGLSQNVKEMWQLWQNLPDDEIIYQAIDHGFVPLAQTFFIMAKGKNQAQASELIENTADIWILKLLKECQVSQCQKILFNLGHNPIDKLKKIYLTRREDHLQTFLFGFLSNQNALTEEEISAGLFLRQLKQSLKRIFPDKKTASVFEDKFQLTVGFVLNQSLSWRDKVWAEVALNSGDIELQAEVNPSAAWTYLLLSNRVDLLEAWMDRNFGSQPSRLHPSTSQQQDKMERLRALFHSWEITQEMVDVVNLVDCMKFTKEAVLDHLSRYGIFCTTEKNSLNSILMRFVRTENLSNINCILNHPSSVLTPREFASLLLKFCVQHRLDSVLFACLADTEDLTEVVSEVSLMESSSTWLQSWLTLVQLADDPENNLLSAVESSLHHLAQGDTASYLEERPYLILALVLLSQYTASEALSPTFVPQDPLTPELIDAAKKAMPILGQVLTPETWASRQQPDITLYELLEKASVFDITKLFGWQELHRKKSEDFITKLPHFSKGSAFEKYAHQECIDFEYYLKQARPSYAYCVFVVEQFKYHKKLSKKRKKQACNVAHGVALSNFSNTRIVAACISFIEMLGLSSDKARLHVKVGNLILEKPQANEPEVCGLLQRLLYNRQAVAPQLLSLLESSLVPSNLDNSLAPIQQWCMPVKFARVHGLPLPESLLAQYAKADLWLQFVVCLELFQYPAEKALHLTNSFTNEKIKEHLFNAFSQSSEKSCVESTKKEPQLQLRDARKFLYSRIGLTAEDRSNDSSSDASSIAEGVPMVVGSSEGSSGPSFVSRCVRRLSGEGELFPTLLACHVSHDPPHELLAASLAHSSPLLAVLASCYKPCSLVTCLCTWLVSSLSPATRVEAEEQVGTSLHGQMWSRAHVQALLVLTVDSGHIGTLATGLSVFLPENPLCALVQFIKQCVIDKNFEDSAEHIQTFKTKCQNLPVAVLSNESGSFLKDRHWIYSVAVQLVCSTLAKSFTSSFHQYRFLHLLCHSSFSEYIPVEAPDFAHLLQLQECLLETGVQLDYSALCVSRLGSESELQTCLDRLVAGRFFKQALQLGRIAGLPRDAVVIAQWNVAIQDLEESGEGNLKFWNKCQAAFEEANIQPIVAAEFFQQHAETRTVLSEKHLVLRLSHGWFNVAKQQSPRKRPDCYLTKAVEVELEMWQTRLKLHSITEPEASPSCKLFTKTKKDVMSEAGVGFLEMETKLENENETEALEAVIGELLDQGDLVTAVRLEGLFCYKNKNVQILLTCLSLAEGELLPYQLSSEQRLMIERTIIASGSFRRRPLHSLRVSSLTSMSVSPNNSSIGSEYVEIPPREQQDTLAALEKLAERLSHGRAIGARIAACFQVAMNMDRAFVDIITVEDTLGLLKTAISKDCLNKFVVASDLSSADQISKETMAEFLCEEIVSAVSKGHLQGFSSTAEYMAPGGLMWGCELDTSFHLVLELCPEPALLGKNLLAISAKLNSSQPEALKQVHTVVVELLVRAHDCYTAACDMEGIALVLQRARALTSSLLQQTEWQLMVRLVTGIGRYTEMGYIFQILKDHEHFEYLLGKGMDKIPGLKLALLEFVRSRCAQDRELLRLVALHFQLYSEVAGLWEGEASAVLHSLLNVAKLELGAVTTASAPTPTQLKASQDTALLLKMAMQNYAHAAEYYLQANKLTKAMQSAHQAELVALQVSLTNGVPAGQLVDCLLEQESAQLTQLITHKLSFPQASIVVKAYGHPVDWGAALFQHIVLQREQKYLTDFTQAMTLTPALVEDVARRFQRESGVTQEMARMMSQLVGLVQCVEVKYRVASQLGFKDVLEAMLASPDLPYLKDTVWRRGLNKHF